jgi:catechol 2,3-dioxygenase-like lactoylglutathione lyase family enzyme
MDEVMLSKAGLATVMPVRKMDRAIRFYTKILGGSVNMRAEGDRRNYFASISLGKEHFWLVKPEKRERRDLAYTTFIVKDIKRTVADLKSKGVKFLRAERMDPDSRVNGTILYTSHGAESFFKDSEGNQLMLWAAPPGFKWPKGTKPY